MLSLQIDKIAEPILPNDFDSNIGVSCASCNSNVSYSYFYDREISDFQINVNKNSSIIFINSNIDKSLECKLDLGSIDSKSSKVQTSLIYNPYLQSNLTLVNQIQNLIRFKNYSIPFFKVETINNNDFNIYLKQKIRPFTEENNSKILKINIENSYSKASNILCSNIHFIFPLARFSLFTNTKQSIFSMKLKKIFSLSFVFDNNHFVTSLPEIYIENPLKRICSFSHKKNKLLDKSYFESDKLGLKYDSGNNFFLLRYENRFRTTKSLPGTFDGGFSLVYRANAIKTSSAIKYTTKNNDKLSFSFGKTEDMKLSTTITAPFKDIALFTTGFCIGPAFTKYPSKSFCFNINFFD